MAAVVFDTSALVKLLVVEEGTDLLEQLWAASDVRFASRLAHPETFAALAAVHRAHRISGSRLFT